MRVLLALALSLCACPAFANYYDDPNSPGRHYDCSKPGTVVQYENNQVIFLCGGLVETTERHFWKGTITHWAVVDPSKLLVKSTGHLTQAEVDAVALGQLQTPFYDSSEKRMVRSMGAGLALDLATTAAGISWGGCSEAGPAKHVPVLGLGILIFDFGYTRHWARKTPRFFTTSGDWENYASSATHGVAAAHNLLACVL